MSVKLNIQPDALISGLMIPPIAFRDKADLNEFYGEVSKSYEYDSISHLNPGARIVNQSTNSEINILPNRVQIIEHIKNGFPFQTTKEKVSDIIRKVFLKRFKNQIKPSVIIGYGMKMFANIDLQQGDNAGNDFLKNIVNLGPDRLRLLGETQKLATGLRFHFFRSNAQYDLRIEPLFQDLGHLFVDLDVQFPGGPIDLIEQKFEDSIKETKDYFTNDVGEFLEYWGKKS